MLLQIMETAGLTSMTGVIQLVWSNAIQVLSILLEFLVFLDVVNSTISKRR